MSQHPSHTLRRFATAQSINILQQAARLPAAQSSVQATSIPSVQAARIPAAQPSIQMTPPLPTVSQNLIVNGDTESGPGADDGSNKASIVVSTIPGWTRTGNFNVMEYN